MRPITSFPVCSIDLRPGRDGACLPAAAGDECNWNDPGEAAGIAGCWSQSRRRVVTRALPSGSPHPCPPKIPRGGISIHLLIYASSGGCRDAGAAAHASAQIGLTSLLRLMWQ